MAKRKSPKRLVLDVELKMHSEIKMRAAKKNCTIREWVLMAIASKINREMIDEI